MGSKWGDPTWEIVARVKQFHRMLIAPSWCDRSGQGGKRLSGRCTVCPALLCDEGEGTVPYDGIVKLGTPSSTPLCKVGTLQGYTRPVHQNRSAICVIAGTGGPGACLVRHRVAAESDIAAAATLDSRIFFDHDKVRYDIAACLYFSRLSPATTVLLSRRGQKHVISTGPRCRKTIGRHALAMRGRAAT